MDPFSIFVDDVEYIIKPALHENMYQVSNKDRSFLAGKRKDGEWEVILQDSEEADVSAEAIGKAIEDHVGNNH